MAHPDEIGARVTSPYLYVVVPDCTPIYDRVKAAGAEILAELRTMDYSGQAFTFRGPEGYLWSLGEYDRWAALPGPIRERAWRMTQATHS